MPTPEIYDAILQALQGVDPLTPLRGPEWLAGQLPATPAMASTINAEFGRRRPIRAGGSSQTMIGRQPGAPLSAPFAEQLPQRPMPQATQLTDASQSTVRPPPQSFMQQRQQRVAGDANTVEDIARAIAAWWTSASIPNAQFEGPAPQPKPTQQFGQPPAGLASIVDPSSSMEPQSFSPGPEVAGMIDPSSSMPAPPMMQKTRRPVGRTAAAVKPAPKTAAPPPPQHQFMNRGLGRFAMEEQEAAQLSRGPARAPQMTTAPSGRQVFGSGSAAGTQYAADLEAGSRRRDAVLAAKRQEEQRRLGMSRGSAAGGSYLDIFDL